MSRLVTSLTNPTVKSVRGLHLRKEREQSGLFVAEGLKVAEQKPHPHGHGWSIVNNVDKWSW